MIKTILNKCFKKEKLNILEVPVHERHQTGVAKTGHNFYNIRHQTVKDWNTDFAPIPENIILLNPDRGVHQILDHIDIDIVLCGNRVGAFQLLEPIAKKYKVPLITMEHCGAYKLWTPAQIKYFNSLRGDLQLFITNWNRKDWGYDETNAEVVLHGIDTEIFCRKPNIQKKPYILSTVNDISGRPWYIGKKEWDIATEGLPRLNVGKDPNWKPAKDIEDLVRYHNEGQIFINTSLVSPIPMSLLESASCESTIITSATCEIPTFFKHEEHAIVTNDPLEMRKYAIEILANPQKWEYMGKNARKMVLENFPMDKHVARWEEIFRRFA